MARFLLILFLLELGCTNKQSKSINENENVITSEVPEFGDAFWTVSKAPILNIGEKNGAFNYQFFRSYSAVKLDDGTLVVSNSGTSEIRWFDSNGVFIRSVGQEGRGPGDFAQFSSMRIHKYADSLLVVTDGSNDRISLYSESGEYLESRKLPKIDEASFPKVMDIFNNSDFLVWANVGSGGLNGDPGSLIKLKFGLHRISKDWTYKNLITEKNSRTRYVNLLGETINYPFIPFSPPPSYVTGTKNNLLFTSGAEPIIELIDSSGVSLSKFAWDFPRKRVNEVWERYKKESLNSLSDNREKQYRHFYNQALPLPDFVPAISELKTDSEGNIWSKRYSLPWEAAQIWDVLNQKGTWLGTVTTPEGVTITEIGENYLLGYTDKNGFRQIVVFSLDKSTAR